MQWDDVWLIGYWMKWKGCGFLCFLCHCTHTALVDTVMSQFTAARKGDLQQLRVALTAGNVNDVDLNGWTALLYAANTGNVDCVKFCIEMGANVKVHDRHGYTPLHLASLHGCVNVARVLLDAGAIVDMTDDDGWTPLYWAIRNERGDIACLLIDRAAILSYVKLDGYVPAIPDWVTTLIEAQSKCRSVSIAIIGIHKYRRTTLTGNNDISVLRLISKHIWSTRMDDVWVTT
jgi:ankyrin repeat protein